VIRNWIIEDMVSDRTRAIDLEDGKAMSNGDEMVMMMMMI
jgi:hypothetical protein